MRQSLELRAGIEPALSPWQGDVIPLDQRSTPESAIRNSFWCWRKDSNLHQTGFEPVASAGWATPARFEDRGLNIEDGHRSSILDPRFSIFDLWYRRRDSNPHQLVSKTSASARLGYIGKIRESKTEDLGWQVRTLILNRLSSVLEAEAAGVEPAQEFTRRLSTPLPYH